LKLVRQPDPQIIPGQLALQVTRAVISTEHLFKFSFFRLILIKAVWRIILPNLYEEFPLHQGVMLVRIQNTN
jgi:hypothetical protein